MATEPDTESICYQYAEIVHSLAFLQQIPAADRVAILEFISRFFFFL